MRHAGPVSGEPTTPSAAAINRELTAAIADAGRAMGLEVVTEYAVPGGRLDVVWLWQPPSPIVGLEGSLPVVGFEIESSWRTRKHVKGDLLNLMDAGVALGVIVLADADPRDEGLQRFATALVERPGCRVLVWTHDDVRALARGWAGVTEVTAAAVEAVDPAQAEHRGKYRPLWAWLRDRERASFQVSFAEIERVLGFPLPESCRTHLAHWYSYEGSAVARAIIDAGWHAEGASVNEGTVRLVPGAPARRR